MVRASILVLVSLAFANPARAESWGFDFDFGVGDSFYIRTGSAQYIDLYPQIAIVNSSGTTGAVRSTFMLAGNFEIELDRVRVDGGSGWVGFRVSSQNDWFETRRGRTSDTGRAEIRKAPDILIDDTEMSFDYALHNVARIGSTVARGAMIQNPGTPTFVSLVASTSFSSEPVWIDMYADRVSGYFDDLSITADRIVTPDFNRDTYFTCEDIDALVTAIAASSTDLLYDLTFDDVVDLQDISEWLEWAGPIRLGVDFLHGDANLDGQVDGSDFGIWNSNKFTPNPSWCSGDFNADGVIDGSDFGVWNQNKFTSGGVAVPEPMTAWLVVLFVACCTRLPRQ